jgi:competence protein ComEC
MRRKYLLIGLAILAGLNVLAWIAVFDLRGQQGLTVNFFDVGQGDATFIETPGGHQILIDGGPSLAILEKLGKVMPFWDRTIDLIVLSHPEKDHMAGLLEVLKRYKVQNILWTGVLRDTPEYEEWASLIKKERADVFMARAGEKIVSGAVEMAVLYPYESLENDFLQDSNETSVVAKLQYGRNSLLFIGDIGQETEKKLSLGSANIDSDVLKIAHHGSRFSSSEEFIKKVSPSVALIGVGAQNSYGHPTKEVLDRLHKYGINILRTDINGDIKIVSDGNNINFK